MKTIIDLDEVEANYRVNARRNIERNVGNSTHPMQIQHKEVMLELIEVNAAFSRFVAQCQNAERHPFIVGYAAAFTINMMLNTLTGNVNGSASLAAMQRGLEIGRQDAGTLEAETCVVQPRAVS